VEEFCDSVFVINHGRLVASGSVKDLLKPHERIVRVSFQGTVPGPEFFVNQPQVRHAEPVAVDTLEITLAQDDSAWLNRCLLEAGYKVSAIAPRQRSLKEFFLSITGDTSL
jgi:ABC-type multidrug transport system ATPase subunit